MNYSDPTDHPDSPVHRSGIIIAVLICGCLLVGSIPRSLAAELNISPNQLPVVMGQYLDYFEDPAGELTIDDILAGDPPWRRSSQDAPTLGLSGSAHWFYFTLSSEGMEDANLVLSLAAPNLDLAEFFFVQGDSLVHQTAVGDTIAFTALEQPYRLPIVPFQIATTGDTTRVYFRAISQSGVEVPLTLTTMQLLMQEQQWQLTFFGAYFTFFGICFLACSLFYYFLKDNQFLGYTLFFSGTIVFFLAQTGMGRLWFWGNAPQFNNRATYLSAALMIASMCLLGQTLHLNSHYRDQILILLKFVAYSMIPVSLYFLFIPFDRISSENITVLIYVGLLAVITILSLSATAAVQGSRTAIYLFASWSLIVLAYSSLLAYKFSLIQRSPVTDIVGELGTLLAALMLLLSLAEFVRFKNEEFTQARLESKAKADFLKNVSREFLTPVHLILANSKRLLAAQSKKLDEATRQHMTTVIKQSDHLHNLINDLLEMAELESDSFEPEFELVEITHFLTEVRNMLLPSAMEKGLEIETDFASANLLVQTDTARLQHVLVNIITNAIKFTDQGGIVIGHKAVYFRRRLGIEIFVRDSGRGMSEEFQQRMFQEFARENPGSEKEPEGTGLGMVIVKRVVEKLGGEISFTSSEGTGSEFFIRLPLRESFS